MSQLMKNKVGQQVKPFAKGGVISAKAKGKADIPDMDDSKAATGKSKSPGAKKEMLKRGGKC